jgi:hypothetical protein
MARRTLVEAGEEALQPRQQRGGAEERRQRSRMGWASGAAAALGEVGVEEAVEEEEAVEQRLQEAAEAQAAQSCAHWQQQSMRGSTQRTAPWACCCTQCCPWLCCPAGMASCCCVAGSSS